MFDAYRGVRFIRYAVTPDGQRFLMIVPPKTPLRRWSSSSTGRAPARTEPEDLDVEFIGITA